MPLSLTVGDPWQACRVMSELQLAGFEEGRDFEYPEMDQDLETGEEHYRFSFESRTAWEAAVNLFPLPTIADLLPH